MNRLFLRIQFHWDWWIYRRAFSSIDRLCGGNPGFAYLLRFWLDGRPEDWIISMSQEPVADDEIGELCL